MLRFGVGFRAYRASDLGFLVQGWDLGLRVKVLGLGLEANSIGFRSSTCSAHNQRTDP